MTYSNHSSAPFFLLPILPFLLLLNHHAAPITSGRPNPKPTPVPMAMLCLSSPSCSESDPESPPGESPPGEPPSVSSEPSPSSTTRNKPSYPTRGPLSPSGTSISSYRALGTWSSGAGTSFQSNRSRVKPSRTHDSALCACLLPQRAAHIGDLDLLAMVLRMEKTPSPVSLKNRACRLSG